MSKRGLLICVSSLMLQTAAATRSGAQVAEGHTTRRCVVGTVISSETGRSVEAIVRLEGFDSTFACSTISGHFTCCGDGAGSYELDVSAPGYEWTRITLDSNSGQPVTVALQSRPGRELPRAAGVGPSVSLKSLQVPRQALEQLNRFFREAEKKDWQKGLESLRKAIEIYPEYVDAWTNMGVVYAQINDAPMAERAFKKALEIEPNNALVRRKLGYLYLSGGQWDKALAELNMSKSLDPSDTRTDTYLQYVKEHMQKP